MSLCMIQWITFSKIYWGWIAISISDIIVLPAFRHSRVGCEPARSRVSVWVWRSGTIQWHKWHWHDLPCTSIGHGGLQMAFQQHCTNCLVCTQLLLQVRECCYNILSHPPCMIHLHIFVGATLLLLSNIFQKFVTIMALLFFILGLSPFKQFLAG